VCYAFSIHIKVSDVCRVACFIWFALESGRFNSNELCCCRQKDVVMTSFVFQMFFCKGEQVDELETCTLTLLLPARRCESAIRPRSTRHYPRQYHHYRISAHTCSSVSYSSVNRPFVRATNRYVRPRAAGGVSARPESGRQLPTKQVWNETPHRRPQWKASRVL